MTDKPENPPAFPWAMQENTVNGSSGMTLRDWFAGQALAGVLGNRTDTPAQFAFEAYALADAMLAARGDQ